MQQDETVGSSGAWNTEETKALLDVWGADNVQSQVDGVVQNQVAYQSVGSGLAELYEHIHCIPS